eukprot:221447_1
MDSLVRQMGQVTVNVNLSTRDRMSDFCEMMQSLNMDMEKIEESHTSAPFERGQVWSIGGPKATATILSVYVDSFGDEIVDVFLDDVLVSGTYYSISPLTFKSAYFRSSVCKLVFQRVESTMPRLSENARLIRSKWAHDTVTMDVKSTLDCLRLDGELKI